MTTFTTAAAVDVFIGGRVRMAVSSQSVVAAASDGPAPRWDDLVDAPTSLDRPVRCVPPEWYFITVRFTGGRPGRRRVGPDRNVVVVPDRTIVLDSDVGDDEAADMGLPGVRIGVPAGCRSMVVGLTSWRPPGGWPVGAGLATPAALRAGETCQLVGGYPVLAPGG